MVPEKYRATAQLTYLKQPDISTALLGTSPLLSSVDVARELDTYANLMTTEVMAARAAKELGVPPGADLGADITATAVKDTAILRITAVSEDPARAQKVANAYAVAFEKSRLEATLTAYERAQDIIEQKMRRFSSPEQKQDPEYYALASRLQDLKIMRAAASGNFVIAAPAPLPNAPFSPNHVRNLLLGLFAGVLLGLVLVGAVEQLDVRVHSTEELGEAVGLPLIGRLPRLTRDAPREPGLAVLDEPTGQHSEAYRMLRSNLDFVNVDGDVKSIMITSPTQGEGKTTTLCNLAVTLAQAGKHAIVVDCDLRRPRVHRYFGLPNRDGVSTLVTGQRALEELLTDVETKVQGAGNPPARNDLSDRGSLRVLTAGPLPPNPGEIVTSRRMAEIIAGLTAVADVVLIDAPPFLVVGDASALAKGVDGIVLVMRLGTATRAIVRDSVEFLRAVPCRGLGLVVTNIPAEAASYRYRYYHESSGAEADTRVERAGEGVTPV